MMHQSAAVQQRPDGFFQGWKPLRLNDFHANGLAPSGGHILSSSAKKEYGKKDAARVAGCSPPYEPTPWVGVGDVGGLYWLPGKLASASVP